MSDLEEKNAKNLNNTAENTNEIIERPQISQLSPRSISDRLKQPKLDQQKLTEAKTPQSPTNAVEKTKVTFKLGEENQEKQTSPPPPPPTVNNKVSTANQSLKQRINSLVLKTLQENTGRDRLNNQSYHQESWKVKLFQNTRVVCSVRECQMIVDEIFAKTTTGTDPEWPFTSDKVAVALDCEGINLGLKGQLTLIQIATMNGSSYVFDLISCAAMIEAGLKRLLESTDVVKVSFGFENRMIFAACVAKNCLMIRKKFYFRTVGNTGELSNFDKLNLQPDF